MKNSCIVYFLTLSLFLGFGISLLFLQSGKDAYFGAFLGMLIGCVFTYFFQKIIVTKKDLNLKDFLQKDKKIGLVIRVLFIIFSYFLIIYSLAIYETFVSSFLLIKTPHHVILIPFIGLACYAAFKGCKVISRVACGLFPLSVILYLLAFLGVARLFETTNFLPVLTNSPSGFLKNIFTFAGISTFPNILCLHLKGDPKGFIKMYVLASITVIALLIYVNGIFGEALVHVFRFPEYMVLKQLKLFQFIEKVENILSLTWIFNLFITLTMAIYSLKNLLPEKKSKLTTIIILIMTIYVVAKYLGFDYNNELRIYYILPYLSFAITIIIISLCMYLIKKIKRKETEKTHKLNN